MASATVAARAQFINGLRTLANVLGAPTRNSLGHYSAERAFGPITYRVVAVSDAGELEGDE